MAYQTPRIDPATLTGYSWNQITQQLQGLKRQQAMALWQWASLRYSSIGTEQERYFKRYGAAATFERINRVRAWLGLAAI
jgi:hypothetical protein